MKTRGSWGTAEKMKMGKKQRAGEGKDPGAYSILLSNADQTYSLNLFLACSYTQLDALSMFS
jgi:hypothetical protein